MFSFIKKLFGINDGNDSLSSLMEQATNSAMMNEAGRTSVLFTEKSPDNLYDEADYHEMSYQKYIRKKYPDAFAHEQDYGMEDDELLQQMQDQQLRDMQEMDRQMNEMHDPYLNPGQDIVVDESYHGIDHGMDHMDSGGHHHDF